MTSVETPRRRIEVYRTIIRANGTREDKGLSAVYDSDPDIMEADIAALGDPDGRGRVTPSPDLLAMTPQEFASMFPAQVVTS